jgi:uncharacterized LabA/DUF88 family protein
MRLRIFIDFWNFVLNWNGRAAGGMCDWTRLPLTLMGRAQNALAQAGLGALTLEETRIYASYEPGRDAALKGWLHSFLEKQPGFRVFAMETHWKKHVMHCRSCGADFAKCPRCQADFGRAAEKTVDSHIVTDLLSLAWEGAFDVALLLSSDRDFLPAVEKLQSKNFKVINATWHGYGHELSKVCWASFEVDSVVSELKR